MSEKSFKVGDHVQWSSQAGGSTKPKIGVIEKTVPAGMPVLDYTQELRWPGGPRQTISYLVRVPGKTAASKGQLYWPHTSRLSVVKGK